MNDLEEINHRSEELHRKAAGKIAIKSAVKVKDAADLALVYTPGVATPRLETNKKRKSNVPYFIGLVIFAKSPRFISMLCAFLECLSAADIMFSSSKSMCV